MKTRILKETEMKEAARILENGGLVAIPTETVYGLAANALNEGAVARIFQVKGRAQDNPLIVHISEMSMLPPLLSDIPKKAQTLAKAFWPGPLTMVLPRSPLVPAIVSAGLDTVAVRMPSHPLARAVISCCGLPLAAPSANRSGSPSPTCAAHVLLDLKGKIPAVLDGGDCAVGVESTVVSLCGSRPRLLRPGGVTAEQLREALGDLEVASGVLHPLSPGERPASPGMKYKHYAPRAEVTLVKGSREAFARYLAQHAGPGVFALCFSGDGEGLPVPYVSYGAENDAKTQAKALFAALRELDRLGAQTVYARCPHEEGIGLAVLNRMLRAAAFRVVEAEKP